MGQRLGGCADILRRLLRFGAEDYSVASTEMPLPPAMQVSQVGYDRFVGSKVGMISLCELDCSRQFKGFAQWHLL